MEQALQKEPENADALANLLVLQTIQGQDRTETRAAFEKAAPSHHLLADWQEKKAEFAAAAAKFKPRVAAT